jgi:hypothetical protein
MVKRVNRRKSVSKKGKYGISKSLRKRRQSRKKRGKGGANTDFKRGDYVLLKAEHHDNHAGLLDKGEHAIILQVIEDKVIEDKFKIGSIDYDRDFLISTPIPKDKLEIAVKLPPAATDKQKLKDHAEIWWKDNPTA